MKPLVLASCEDASGDRCVDILQLGQDDFGFSECRRDPEDPHGWRRIAGVTSGFSSASEARGAAAASVAWFEAQD